MPLSAAAFAGVLAVILPVALNPTLRHYDAPLFSWVRTGWEGAGLLTVFLLGLAGLGVALISRTRPLVLGIATMALFPVMSVAEVVVDPTSHNLLPLEWLMYLAATAPGIAGAYLGQGFRRLLGSEEPR